jgi:tight adherence protein C
MDTTWLLVVAGIGLLVVLFGRWISGGSRGRRIRPVPEELQSSIRPRQLAADVPEDVLFNRPVFQGAASMRQDGFTGGGSLASSVFPSIPGAATIPIAAGSHSRLSTYDNRRLFGEFRGILSSKEGSLPAPEELPILPGDLYFGALTPALAELLPESAARREAQRKSLLGAGYLSRASWLNLTAIRFVLAFLSLVITGFWLLMAPPALEPWLLGAVVLAPLFFWALPPLIVSWQASERKIDIERGLPDVLDMLNMGVSQGLTVPQSLRRISREITSAHPAIAQELQLVERQAEVGSLPQALRNFADRVDSPEVNSFTSLLIQADATGSSISRALTEYSDSMRASLKERADARANAASFQLLFPVTLCLMPSVFLFLLGPAIVQMSDFFANQGAQLQQNREEAIRSLDQQPVATPLRFIGQEP